MSDDKAKAIITLASEREIKPGETMIVRETDFSWKSRKLVTFEGGTIIIPHECGDFLIIDLQMGRKPQLIPNGGSGIPAMIFSPMLCSRCREEILPGLDIQVTLSPLAGKDDVTMKVTNRGKKPMQFRASIMGNAV